MSKTADDIMALADEYAFDCADFMQCGTPNRKYLMEQKAESRAALRSAVEELEQERDNISLNALQAIEQEREARQRAEAENERLQGIIRIAHQLSLSIEDGEDSYGWKDWRAAAANESNKWKSAFDNFRKKQVEMKAENERLRELLRAVMDCDDLTGWCGPDASPLYDRIADILPHVPDAK